MLSNLRGCNYYTNTDWRDGLKTNGLIPPAATVEMRFTDSEQGFRSLGDEKKKKLLSRSAKVSVQRVMELKAEKQYSCKTVQRP